MIRDLQNITLEGSQMDSAYSVIFEPRYNLTACPHQHGCNRAGNIQLLNVSNVVLVGINVTSLQSLVSRTKIGVLMKKADSVVVRLLAVKNFYHGIALYDVSDSNLTDIVIDNSFSDGIFLSQTSNISLINAMSQNNRGNGLSITSAESYFMLNVTSLNNRKKGLLLKNCASQNISETDSIHDKYTSIWNVTSSSNWLQGVSVQSCNNTRMTYISLRNNGASGLLLWWTYGTQIKHVWNTGEQREGIAMVETFDTLLMNVASPITAYQSFNIHIANSSFIQKNVFSSKSAATLTSSAVIMLYGSNASISNCNFIQNSVSSVKLFSSNITVHGNIMMSNNTAVAGTGLIFAKSSNLFLTEKSHMYFGSNHAINNGGVFHISNDHFYKIGWSLVRVLSAQASALTLPSESDIIRQTPCFLHVEGRTTQKRMTFENNTSGNGGDVLYGGSLALGWDRVGWNCLLSFKNISDMSQQKGYSQISSAPSRVCLCNSVGEPDCLIAGDPHKRTIYPGQTINISAVVVGQDFGTVAGSVYTQFLNSGTNGQLLIQPHNSNPDLQPNACTTLKYTVFLGRNDISVSNVVLVLTAVKKKVSTITNFSDDKNLIHVWRKYANKEGGASFYNALYVSRSINSSSIRALLQFTNRGQFVFPDELQKLPVYINISVLICPFAFWLRANPPFKCDCDPLLMQIKGVECQIEDQTISRSGLVWIGQEEIGNKTVAVSEYCPFNYCKNQNIRISLSDTDSQCNYNHSGTLCGGCQSGLSLVLGSDECQTCSNNYLSLLLVFFFAGIMLVVSIKVLDITISQGTMNGLIFYANVVKAIDYIVFPSTDITLFIAWFNLDLGVKVCFFNGLNAYSKTWLQFVFPLYIWSIAWLIIMLAKRCDRVAKMMGKNSISVLATLFLLSYAKLFRTIITSLSFTIIHTSESSKAVWSADGNVDYLSPRHIPLFIVATAILLFLWLPYTLLLFSEQWLHKLNCCVIIRLLIKMKPFLDAHYGSLTDHHRYWFGALLLVKATVLLLSALLPVDHTSVKILSVAISSTALLFWTQVVYRNQKTSLFNASLFANLILLSVTNFFTTITRENTAIAANTLIGVAITQFLGLILFKIYTILKVHSRKITCLSAWMYRRLDAEDDWDLYELATQGRDLESDENATGQSDESGSMESLPTYGM